MFGLTKLITVVILPPFNVLILWLLSLLFSVLHYKKLSRLCALLGLTILYINASIVIRVNVTAFSTGS